MITLQCLQSVSERDIDLLVVEELDGQSTATVFIGIQ